MPYQNDGSQEAKNNHTNQCTLEELLENSPPESFDLDDEDRAWLNDKQGDEW